MNLLTDTLFIKPEKAVRIAQKIPVRRQLGFKKEHTDLTKE